MNDCVFCRVVCGELPSWKVYEDEHTLAFFDVNPTNEYHTLVVPKQHYKDIFEIPQDELGKMMSSVKNVADLLKKKVNIGDMQIVQSNGKDGQQDVYHIHFHVVPRQNNDGQDIKWKPKTELKEHFDELLANLK